MDINLIDRYEAGAESLRQAVAGLTRDDLLARPGPGAWSIQELVVHVVDSDCVAADRMKRVIAEENPPLVAFDESRWAAELFPHEQSLDDALQIFVAGRRQMTRILRRLPVAAFQRTGVHNERGLVTLEQIVQTFVQHLEHHLKFLHEKRERLGKPIGHR
jgi:uncharacterized damage-inducible protein DinB